MLFLDTNEIEQLKQEVYDEPTINSPEGIGEEIDRLTKIKDKLSQAKLNEEIKEIASDYTRSRDVSGNVFARGIAHYKAKKRLGLAQKRFNSAMQLSKEIDQQIEDLCLVQDYYALLDKKSYASYGAGWQSNLDKDSSAAGKSTEPQL